jgi:hypothetical protein
VQSHRGPSVSTTSGKPTRVIKSIARVAERPGLADLEIQPRQALTRLRQTRQTRSAKTCQRTRP